jgi:hypothetical protein
MRCPHCDNEIRQQREYCPKCGQRIEFRYEDIASKAGADVLSRRQRDWIRNLRAAIIFLGIAIVVMLGLNGLWDRPLVYSGADTPAIDPPRVRAGKDDRILGAPQPLRAIPPLPVSTPRAFGYRRMPTRKELLVANKGSEMALEAIRKGLRYLRGKQAKDGGFPVTTAGLRIRKERDESKAFKWARIGLTGLAALAFLGEGEYWEPDEQGHRPKHAMAVKRALSFLMKSQDPVNGRFGPADGNFMYNHGLATLAVSEAAGLSGDPILRAAAQRGVDLIERIQGNRGGWGYRDVIGARQDTSVSAWQMQALLAAREAGLKVNEEGLQRALKFYQDATDSRTGIVAYDFKDNLRRPGLFGVALMLRLQMGESVESREIKLLVRNVMERMPKAEKGWGKGWREGKDEAVDSARRRAFDPYRWYFSTYGLFFYGTEPFQEWNRKMTDALVLIQDSDGAWRANDIWSVKVGTVYSTSMSVLALQACYRIH